jgi:hypothetical protein
MNPRVVTLLTLTSLLLLLVLRGAPAGAVEVPLHRDSVVRFASVEEATAVLTQRDHFISSLSRFDRQARLATGDEVTDEALLKFIAAQALPWPDEDVQRITPVLESIRTRLDGYRPLFPATVLLVLTTGKEEGNAAYCRTAAIVLPQHVVKKPVDELERLLIHELFHILSRHDAKLRQSLYAVIGFKPFGEIALPASLRDRKITNPDAPTIDYYIELKTDGQTINAAPLLYASVDRYDPQQGGSFFRYLLFRMLVIRQSQGKWQAVEKDGQPVVLDPKMVPSFYDQIGKNTNYVIHPDEILADNFVHLLKGTAQLATPRVVAEMKTILQSSVD